MWNDPWFRAAIAAWVTCAMVCFAAWVHCRATVKLYRDDAECARKRAADYKRLLDIECERKTTWLERAGEWRERAAEWRKLYLEEREKHGLTTLEHVSFVKALAPAYVVQAASGAPAEEPETVSVSEADRRAAARKRDAENAERIRSGGFEPVVVPGEQPPFRFDATVHDERDEDGDGG